MKTRSTPYNTGKVKIGLAFEPRNVRTLTDDESRLQDALLGLYDNRQDRAIKRYVGLVLFAIALAMVVSYAHR